MRYKATGTLTWEFDSDLPLDEAMQMALHHLESQLPNGFKISVRTDQLKEKIHRVTIGEFKMEDIFPYLCKGKKEYVVDGKSYQVKMNSQRYFLFRECRKCVACGLKATKVFLEHHPADSVPHFNFYGEEDDKLVLFTKDHIHAKAFGGEDKHSNYQTMCLICNNLKGHTNLTIEDVKKLRKFYDENKKEMNKKKLHLLLEEEKMKIARPWPEEKEKFSEKFNKKHRVSGDAVLTNCDIGVWEKEGQFFGKSVYAEHESNQKYVACIRKGTYLEPVMSLNGDVICEFGTDLVSIPEQLVKPKGT